ncbi:MAG TPA: peptidoglycan-binding protein [Gaiellaceae bacterium]|nr:peptidoglycan-binding protein [Gaiellaceae bacterium]
MRYPVWFVTVAAAALLAGVGSASANPQLAGLQVALARHALYFGPIDAELGPLTRAAVRSFQAHQGLVPDGIVGPKTRRALGRLGRPLFGARAIKPGMKGWDVAVLQYLLTRRRLLHARPDGQFGPKTEAAVLRFQRARGLVPDGIVGPATAARLCKLAVCAWRAPRQHSAPTRVTVRSLLDRWADFYGVDRHLVRGLAWQESGFQPQVVSPQGAVGVMQVTPDTWSFVELFVIGHPVAATVEGNIQVGVAYLHYLEQLFGGDNVRAVAAYLQGPASVQAYGISEASQLYVSNVLALSRRL